MSDPGRRGEYPPGEESVLRIPVGTDIVSPHMTDANHFVTADLMDTDADDERFQREAAHAHRVMEATGEGVLILTPDGTCEYANPAAAQLLGWPRDYLQGSNIHTLLHRDHDGACLFEQPFLDALPMVGHTDLFHTSRGRALPVTATVNPSIRNGVVDSVVCMFADATARLRHEREQQELLAAQRAAVERLEDLASQQKDFVSTVSHELRTPLTSIMGFLDLVREDPDLSEENQEFLGIVDRNARRLLSQVEALLLVSRIESGKITESMSHVDLAVIVQDVINAVRPQAEDKGISLIVQVEDDLPPLWADASQLDRVLLNLLSNAIKFTPDGGDVEVTAASARRWVQVQVADTGMGIPQAEQDRLFQKFFRSTISQKKATPGTGLGLAIVKAIIEEHGGKVAIESEEGVGTAVAFTLPCSTEPPAESDGS